VLEGRHGEAIELATETLADESAGDAVRILGERALGYGLHQARRPDEARPHLEESLRLARTAASEYDIALTLRALAETGLGDATAGDEAEAILERLGVTALPRVPLP
jgi:hypothetical protein